MSNDQLRQLRENCAALIESVQEGAKIFPRWISGFEKGACPDWLKTEFNQVWGWLVTVVESDPERLTEELADCETDTVTLRIWGFYQFRHGNDTANSTDEWERHYKAVQQVLSLSQDLNFGPGVVLGKSLLRFKTDVFPYTNALLHVAQGEMTVVLNTPFTDDEV